MNAGEALAKLTAPQRWPDVREERSPGAPASTITTDVAMACRGIARDQWLVLLGKYALERRVMPELYYILELRVVDIAIAQEWDIPRGKELLRTMLQVAIMEIVEAPVCKRCQGRRHDNLRMCKPCDGTGIKRTSGRAMAEIMGLSHSDWWRKWKVRYATVLGLLIKAESTGLEKLASNLRGVR